MINMANDDATRTKIRPKTCFNRKATTMMKATALAAFFLLSQVYAFTSIKQRTNQFSLFGNDEILGDSSSVMTSKLSGASIAGFSTGIVGFISQAMAEDDFEIAELPPPFIPVLFGIVLIAGVGVLTASLGNVMDEEASLGLQSGARAKKEIERSRSSYFKR